MSTKIYLKISDRFRKKPIKKINKEGTLSINKNNNVDYYRDKSNLINKFSEVGIHFFKEDGNPYKKTSSKPCWWCRHPFDSIPIPLPIKREYKKCSSNKKCDKKVHNFYGDGIFFFFLFHYAFISDHNEKVKFKRDSKYNDSECLLLSLFYMLYPNKKLKPANDWRILKNVGSGLISISEFRLNQNTFKLSDNIYYYPISTYYSID